MSNPKSCEDDDLPVIAMRALFGGSLLSIDHTENVVSFPSSLIDDLHSMTLVTQEQEQERCEGEFELEVKKLTGRKIRIPRMTQATKILKLKIVILEKEGTPVDQQRLVFRGQQLEDDRTLGKYGIRDGSVLHLVLRLRGGWFPGRELLDPEFSYDFTNVKSKGVSFSRGNEVYKRPYGWKRYALKVRGKYDSDLWLGEPGLRHHSNDGEWPVSYHGTSKTGGEGIAEKGYDMAKGKRFLYGRGIYSTPDPDIAGLYALPFKHKGEDYKVMVQNRYDPKHTEFIKGMNYLVTEDEKFIRPYGVLVQKA